MRNLAQLPPPPPGRVGWPWTEESPPLPPSRPDGSPWPRLTVVTPSFNQAAFLEETLRSVLLQGYPDLQYVVMDGGSTDGSVALLERYGPFLDFWRSTKDAGQGDAINAGMAKADGAAAGWLNSDDVYAKGALSAVGRGLARPGTAWIAGPCRVLSPDGTTRLVPPALDAPLGEWLFMTQLGQPATFWSIDLWWRAGGLDPTLHFSMDRDLFLRFLLLGARPIGVAEELAVFRVHDRSKTGAQKNRFRWESATRVVPRYYWRFAPADRRQARRAALRKLGRFLGFAR